jgi:alkanesulfonate monooxygenase SsuD/methylene tetrahydromethanopterin reductase-like flavin-dependent oxidoreductase (luciferase family)
VTRDLKFGIFDHLDRARLGIAELFDQRLKIAELYDRLGFYSYHLAEHHSTPLGMAPSPSVFLSAIAQRTKTLRLGPMVYLLPLYHPIRLSEEIAMLDHLSHGRLDIGLGRGRSPIELMLYGRNVDEAQAVFDEALDVLRLAFREQRITYSGKHFSYRNVPVELHPWQKPNPPLWYGVGTPDSAAIVARQGFHGVTLARPDVAAAIVKSFNAAAADAGFANPMMGICRFVVAADTDAEAWALADRAYPIWHESFFELFRRYDQKPMQTWPGEFGKMVELGLAFAGSPATLARTIGDQIRQTGANYMVGQYVFGDMTLAESAKSITLFAEKVAPALRQA